MMMLYLKSCFELMISRCRTIDSHIAFFGKSKRSSSQCANALAPPVLPFFMWTSIWSLGLKKLTAVFTYNSKCSQKKPWNSFEVDEDFTQEEHEWEEGDSFGHEEDSLGGGHVKVDTDTACMGIIVWCAHQTSVGVLLSAFSPHRLMQ